MPETLVAVLLNSLLFEGINKEDLKIMLGCLQPVIRNYARNEFIVLAGERFDGIGIILSGEATVIKENAAGKRILIAMLKPGEMFGEMAAFSKNQVWPVTVHTQGVCTALFLTPRKIIGKCEKACPWHSTLIQNMLKIVSEKALMLNKKVEYLSIKSMRGKIAAFLLEQSRITGRTKFILPLKRGEMADFLNVSRPSMSREMCRMRDEGIIGFHKAKISIIDPERLKTLLE